MKKKTNCYNYTIEKGIEPPPKGSPLIAIAYAMKNGDSVQVRTNRERLCLANALIRRHGKGTTITRKQVDGSYRVWLIK